MLLQRKISPQVIGSGTIADEDAPFTTEIGFFARRVEQTDLTEVISGKERFLTCHQLMGSSGTELRVGNAIDPRDGIHIGFTFEKIRQVIWQPRKHGATPILNRLNVPLDAFFYVDRRV